MSSPSSLADQHRKRLLTGCQQSGLSLSEAQVTLLEAYLANLLKWNKAYNLTAIRDPGEMVVKHLLDSLSIHAHLQGKLLLDVGTGPGLPGLPLSIVDPERQWTLIDSNGKKTRFLLQMKTELKLANVSVIKGRIESLNAARRFDAITSRAFASLTQFVGVCSPLLQKGGCLLAMKGSVPQEEINQLDEEGYSSRVIPLNVPFLHEERHLIVVQR